MASATDPRATQAATAAGQQSAEMLTEKNAVISVGPKNPANVGGGKSGNFSAIISVEPTKPEKTHDRDFVPAARNRLADAVEPWIPADQAKEFQTDVVGRRIDPAGRYLLDLVRSGEGFAVYRGKLRDGREHEIFCWESEAAKLSGGARPQAPPQRRPRTISRTALGKIANNVRNEVAQLPGSPAGRKWLLKRRARPFQRKRVRDCRHKRTVKNSVQVSTDGTGVAITGIETCGSARDCPVCAPNIYAARAEQIVKACKRHRDRGGEVLMLTLTIRHQGSNDLKWLSTKVSEAYRSMRRSRRFQRFWKCELGAMWVIRGDETTHGPKGWHPHLHVLLFVDKKSQLAVQAKAASEHKKTLNGRTNDLLYCVYERWSERVEALLGSAFVPSVERGVVVSLSTDDEYIAKLGLEVAFITEKSGRTDQHRTPWELLQDATDGELEAQRLWREHSKAMLGRRQISWSRGMKIAFGVDDKTDEELAQEQLDREKPRTCFDIAAWLWDYMNHEQPLWLACFVERLRRDPAEAEDLLPSKDTPAGAAWTRTHVEPQATGPPARAGPEAYAHDFWRTRRPLHQEPGRPEACSEAWAKVWKRNRIEWQRTAEGDLRFKPIVKATGPSEAETLDGLRGVMRQRFPEAVNATLPPIEQPAPRQAPTPIVPMRQLALEGKR